MEMGKPDFTEERLTEAVEDALRGTQYLGRKRVYASSAALCARQTASQSLFKSGQSQELKPETQLYFKMGSAAEEVIKRAFKKAGIFVAAEVSFGSQFEWLNIGGRVDFIIKHAGFPGEKAIVELKTCGKLPKKPHKPHIAQLATYCLLTGAPGGFIYYVSRHVADWKNGMLHKAFKIEFTRAELVYHAKQICIGVTFAEENVLPEIPKEMKKSYCGFCPMMNNCWGDDRSQDLIFRPGVNPESKVDATRLHKKAFERAKMLMEAQPNLRKRFFK